MKIESSLNGVMGVYAIRNSENGKVLIGSHYDVGKMLKAHEILLDANKHPNYRFQVDYRQTNKENFETELLEVIEDEFEKSIAHICWSCAEEFKVKSLGRGYNISANGSKGVIEALRREATRGLILPLSNENLDLKTQKIRRALWSKKVLPVEFDSASIPIPF